MPGSSWYCTIRSNPLGSGSWPDFFLQIAKMNEPVKASFLILMNRFLDHLFTRQGVSYTIIPFAGFTLLQSTAIVLILIVALIHHIFWFVKLQNQNRRRCCKRVTTNRILHIRFKAYEFGIGSRLEDPLLKEINALLDLNIENPQFGISNLCRTIGISRAQLYRKFKALNGRTLHDYIRFYRLTRARELLLSTRLNVSEVAYKTGFTNVSHFSRIFAEEFGTQPRDSRKKVNLSHLRRLEHSLR